VFNVLLVLDDLFEAQVSLVMHDQEKKATIDEID